MANRVGVLACVAATAVGTSPARADSAPPLSEASFAYRMAHPVAPLPPKVLARLLPTGGQIVEETDAFNETRTMPLDIRIEQPHGVARNVMCGAVVSVARANDLPLPFFANLIWQESNFDVRSISRSGALGVAQFMPQTAHEFGLINPFEPLHSLYASAHFLRRLAAQFGNLGLAAMAYNAGPRRVIDWMARRGALPSETRDYVARITGRPPEQWVSQDFARGPEATLMPAKAPCAEVADAVAQQAKVVRVAKLMAELADATRPAPPAVPLPQPAPVADASHDDGRVLTMVRAIMKNVDSRKVLVAEARRASKEKPSQAKSAAKAKDDKATHRAWSRIADRTVRKATNAFAQAETSRRNRHTRFAAR
jgi:hypothetical protein